MIAIWPNYPTCNWYNNIGSVYEKQKKYEKALGYYYMSIELKKKINNKQLTHPDKMLYPEDKITKQDLADYYDLVQDWILPYISPEV